MSNHLSSELWSSFSCYLKERGLDVTRQYNSDIALIATNPLTPDLEHKILRVSGKWLIPETLASYYDGFMNSMNFNEIR